MRYYPGFLLDMDIGDGVPAMHIPYTFAEVIGEQLGLTDLAARFPESVTVVRSLVQDKPYRVLRFWFQDASASDRVNQPGYRARFVPGINVSFPLDRGVATGAY